MKVTKRLSIDGGAATYTYGTATSQKPLHRPHVIRAYPIISYKSKADQQNQ